MDYQVPGTDVNLPTAPSVNSDLFPFSNLKVCVVSTRSRVLASNYPPDWVENICKRILTIVTSTKED